MDYKEWLRSRGFDPEKVTGDTDVSMRKIFDMEQKAVAAARAEGGDPKAAEEAMLQRSTAILSSARAASATASDRVARGIMDKAAELTANREMTVANASLQLVETARELMKDGDGEPIPVAMFRSYAVANSDGPLSTGDITDIYSRDDSERSLQRQAAGSLVRHMDSGDGEVMRKVVSDLTERKVTGQLRCEDNGRIRTVTSAAQNVVIQNVLTHRLQDRVQEKPDPTDALVTIIPSTAREDTLPALDVGEGVRRVKEGDPYPFISAEDNTVKTSNFKFGAAIGQTRENALFDQLGRIGVMLTSVARQMRSKRAAFRMARICDSNTFDGRYIARPGNDNGSSVFYTGGNLLADTTLADYTALDALSQKLEGQQLTDGTYVMAALKVLMVPSELKATAWKILNSMYCAPVGSETANPMQVNPYGPQGMYSEMPSIISHPLVKQYTTNATSWFGGDPASQFYEKEVWAPEILAKMTGGEMALRDIVDLWIASFCCDIIALDNKSFIKVNA